MKCILTMVVAAAAVFSSAADTGSVDRVARTRKLVSEYGDSVAMVAFYFRTEPDGTAPTFSIPYLCPNCNSTHYRGADDYLKENRPFECAGFFLSGDEVLVQDPLLRSAWVDRIEVRFGKSQTKYPARPVATFPAEGGMLLRTDRPVEGAKPLEFAKAEKAPEKPVYFYLVREKGFAVAGIKDSRAAEFRHFVDLGRDIAGGVPNTIVIDENDRPVTVALQQRFDLGGEVTAPPAEWKRDAPDACDRKCAAAEKALAAAVVPVYIRLDAKEKERDSYRFRSWSSDGDKVKDENDTCGYALPGGKLLVPIKMNADETARISKMEATLPDGTKRDLEFVGSVDTYGAVVVEFAGEAPKGLSPLGLYDGAITDLFLGKVVCASRKNIGGKLSVKASMSEVGEFAVGFDEKLEFSVSSGKGGSAFVLTEDGRLVAIELSRRSSRKRYGDSDELVYGEELAALMSGRAAYDAELVPRTGEDRIRTAWIGVEVQQLTDSIAREKKAAAFLHTGMTDTDGSLVSKVYPGTPAAELGIKEGDVLLDVRIAGTENRRDLEAESYEMSGIDWSEVYEKVPLDMFGRVDVTPWPAVDKGVNSVFTEIGIGESVIVAWVSDGVRREGETVLRSAPPYFRNAPKARMKDVGLVVKDMTFEVRGYFRFDDDAPGVVIAKVKPGSPAAIAGLRPYEIVTEVDGAKVADAKSFAAAVKDRKEITLSVRRLSATRMVKISVK